MWRTLRAFAWLRWRMLINSMEQTGTRDTLERFSVAIEKILPIMTAILIVPSALGLSALGGGRGLRPRARRIPVEPLLARPVHPPRRSRHEHRRPAAAAGRRSHEPRAAAPAADFAAHVVRRAVGRGVRRSLDGDDAPARRFRAAGARCRRRAGRGAVRAGLRRDARGRGRRHLVAGDEPAAPGRPRPAARGAPRADLHPRHPGRQHDPEHAAGRAATAARGRGAAGGRGAVGRAAMGDGGRAACIRDLSDGALHHRNSCGDPRRPPAGRRAACRPDRHRSAAPRRRHVRVRARAQLARLDRSAADHSHARRMGVDAPRPVSRRIRGGAGAFPSRASHAARPFDPAVAPHHVRPVRLLVHEPQHGPRPVRAVPDRPRPRVVCLLHWRSCRSCRSP